HGPWQFEGSDVQTFGGRHGARPIPRQYLHRMTTLTDKSEERSASRFHRQVLTNPSSESFTPEAQVHAFESDVDGHAVRDHCAPPERASTTSLKSCASKPASTRMAASPTVTSTD